MKLCVPPKSQSQLAELSNVQDRPDTAVSEGSTVQDLPEEDGQVEELPVATEDLEEPLHPQQEPALDTELKEEDVPTLYLGCGC